MQCRIPGLVGVYMYICTHVKTYAGYLGICRDEHRVAGFPIRVCCFHATMNSHCPISDRAIFVLNCTQACKNNTFLDVL